MATFAKCEGWIGDKKKERCENAQSEVTQTYGRRDTAGEIQYGWNCSYCGKFFITQRFRKQDQSASETHGRY
jgi:hypothetical protein